MDIQHFESFFHQIYAQLGVSCSSKCRIRVEPLNVRYDLVNWEKLILTPYLTVSEASLVLNVQEETLRRWIKEGIVKTTRVGKRHLVSREFLINSRG